MIVDLYVNVNKYPDIENCQPISKVITNTDQLKSLMSYFGDAFFHIYFSKDSLIPYFYQHGYVFIHIWDLNTANLELNKVKELIIQSHDRIDRAIQEGDYKRIYTLIEKKARIPFYVQHFQDIPDEQKYDVFRFVYTSSEYGFEFFSEDFLSHVFKYRKHSSAWIESMNLLKNKYFDRKRILIYRGENIRPTPTKQPYSWALSYDIAYFFATRFSNEGCIYQAEVDISDIIDYFPVEEEVLVAPKCIVNQNKKRIFKEK